MPQYTYRDRLCVMQEQSMWNVSHILKEEAEAIDHTWQARIKLLAAEAKKIAQELQEYNGQFEEDDDDDEDIQLE